MHFSTNISPLFAVSIPAIKFKSVVFPLPEGPSKTINSPFAMSRSIPVSTLVLPYDFTTPDKATNFSMINCRIWYNK